MEEKQNKTFRQSNSHFRASRATSAIWFKCGHCSGKFLHISWKFVWISVDPFGTRSPRKNQVRQALASVNPSLHKAYPTKTTTTDNGDVNIFKWSCGHFLFFLKDLKVLGFNLNPPSFTFSLNLWKMYSKYSIDGTASWWLNQPSEKKMVTMGSLPQVVVKIRNISNYLSCHHLKATTWRIIPVSKWLATSI